MERRKTLAELLKLVSDEYTSFRINQKQKDACIIIKKERKTTTKSTARYISQSQQISSYAYVHSIRTP